METLFPVIFLGRAAENNVGPGGRVHGLNVEKCPTKWRLLSSLRQAECQVLKHAEGLQPRDNCSTFTSFDN